DLLVAVLPIPAELRRGIIEHVSNEDERMLKQLDAAVAGDGGRGARGGAILPDVVRDVAVQALVLLLCINVGEQKQRGPHPGPAPAGSRGIDRSPALPYLP